MSDRTAPWKNPSDFLEIFVCSFLFPFPFSFSFSFSSFSFSFSFSFSKFFQNKKSGIILFTA